MDKKVILAVAGSGKTTFIVSKLSLEKRVLVITFTNNNLENLRTEIIRRFGYFPPNIRLLTYFSFLFGFCFRPLFLDAINPRGICYDRPPEWTLRLKRTDYKYYLSEDNRLYHSRLAKILDCLDGLNEVNKRLEKYFDCIYIDEIQDFAGHDFDFLKSISKSDIEILMVGDFFQHTFDTSNDGNINKNIYSNLHAYMKNLLDMGLIIDTKTLVKSYRCSPTVCSFLRDTIGIEIYSHRSDQTAIIHVTEKRSADEIFSNEKMVKLFYSEHYKYGLYSNNWGNSKGLNKYHDVCVILNKTTNKLFNSNKLALLNPQTKNKFYVACTRAKNNLYFISDELLKSK